MCTDKKLFWHLTDFELVAVQDPVLHKNENVPKLYIRQFESRVPEKVLVCNFINNKYIMGNNNSNSNNSSNRSATFVPNSFVISRYLVRILKE
jgi:hypothetical protein